MKKTRRLHVGVARVLALAAALLVGHSAHSVVIINTDATITDSIPGVSSFTTGGDDMVGMNVQAVFSNGLNETLAWAATGVNSGGVSGTNWALSFSGESTFQAPWDFTNNTGALLNQLVLTGFPGLTLFDRSGDNDQFNQVPPACDVIPFNCGTPNSAQGDDFSTAAGPNLTITATYSRQVALTAALPVGDLWNVLSVDFGAGLPDTSWTFLQDTDNDLRVEQIPAPPVWILLALGFVGIGYQRHRKK